MKNINKLSLVIQYIFVGLLILIIPSCESDNYSLPEVTTAEISEIGQVSATAGGIITSDGGARVIAKGVVYSKSPGPTLDNDATNEGVGSNPYTSAMSNLTFGTTYYVRAFAISEETGEAYGNEVSFQTLLPEGVDCLADIWTGDLNCQIDPYGDYGPTYCIGEKMDGDCNMLEVKFDLWGYGEATELVLKLQIGPFDPNTFEGELTLTEDAFVTAEGEDLTFFAGAAGTYKALSNELFITLDWTDPWGDGPYHFNMVPKE